jgi:hypothetical protein
MHILLIFLVLMVIVLFWRLAVKTLLVLAIVAALAGGVFYETVLAPSHASTVTMAAPTVEAPDQGKEYCDTVMVEQSQYTAEQITNCRNLHPDRYGKP